MAVPPPFALDSSFSNESGSPFVALFVKLSRWADRKSETRPSGPLASAASTAESSSDPLELHKTCRSGRSRRRIGYGYA
eukprot:CAMPEP_0178611272 /NCGR_PEP_ID=MMETSP0698-20121128/524_1 /TAXON_ID=265572 /ORGANISM="Extubocellulus spinifer, Strain CCMP396" /LENGTH=78 /DNA_ID=CAMNT_0020249893 /DNA_START=985 /DNA_END=1222 /DNA_ORIENTATION=+